MTLPETRSRFRLPSSIRLLINPGVRGHTLIFASIIAFLFATAYAGRLFGTAQAWTAIFALGASTAGAYLVLSLLTLWEKTERILFHSPMKTRIIALAVVFGPILAGVSYWIQQEGSVEALPIFPLFIAIFYGWILLQAYFIASPVSQLLTRMEVGITGDGHAKKMMRAIGTTVLFLPVVPLVYGVWAISNWLSSTYQNVQGASDKIVGWTILVAVILLFTYFLTLRWGWPIIRRSAPQSAVFVGGTFLVLWGYLLYRATTVVIGYITQNQPSNPILDAGLIIVSIIGAMQTFARKTINMADKRWSRILPFLVFAFGSVYAVAQFYFILQFAITRVELSIVVNATVFATGILTMMYLIRRHLLSAGTTFATPPLVGSQSLNEPSPGGQTKHSMFRSPWKKNSPPEASMVRAAESRVVQKSEKSMEDSHTNVRQEAEEFLEQDTEQSVEQGGEQPAEQEEGQSLEQDLEDRKDPDH